MHLSRRSLQHIARMILAVWLFAFGAGVANACLLNAPNDNTHASFSVASSGTPVAHAHQKEAPNPGTDGCLKFCEEPRLAITKLDQPLSEDVAVVVGTLAQALTPAVDSTTAVRLPVFAHRPAHLASPIVVRPHRLTI